MQAGLYYWQHLSSAGCAPASTAKRVPCIDGPGLHADRLLAVLQLPGCRLGCAPALPDSPFWRGIVLLLVLLLLLLLCTWLEPHTIGAPERPGGGGPGLQLLLLVLRMLLLLSRQGPGLGRSRPAPLLPLPPPLPLLLLLRPAARLVLLLRPSALLLLGPPARLVVLPLLLRQDRKSTR